MLSSWKESAEKPCTARYPVYLFFFFAVICWKLIFIITSKALCAKKKDHCLYSCCIYNNYSTAPHFGARKKSGSGFFYSQYNGIVHHEAHPLHVAEDKKLMNFKKRFFKHIQLQDCLFVFLCKVLTKTKMLNIASVILILHLDPDPESVVFHFSSHQFILLWFNSWLDIINSFSILFQIVGHPSSASGWNEVNQHHNSWFLMISANYYHRKLTEYSTLNMNFERE